jgi:hypothetical protein
MSFAQFQQGLLTLLFVPKEEGGRALSVAERLPDEERGELYKYLKELSDRGEALNREFSVELRQTEDLLAMAEHAVADLGSPLPS